MKNTISPKNPTPARAAKATTNHHVKPPLDADVKAFAKHMRAWWKALDPEHATEILKNMGIKA